MRHIQLSPRPVIKARHLRSRHIAAMEEPVRVEQAIACRINGRNEVHSLSLLRIEMKTAVSSIQKAFASTFRQVVYF
jgi:hypothetical protein